MNIIKILFGNGKRSKLLDVKRVVNQVDVEKQNKKIRAQLLQSKRRIHIIEKEAKKAKIHLDTVIAIAVANGSFDNE